MCIREALEMWAVGDREKKNTRRLVFIKSHFKVIVVSVHLNAFHHSICYIGHNLRVGMEVCWKVS